jgi:hypothetical protein
MRTFGVTARPASGEQPLTGPRTSADTTRANLILFPSGTPLEFREISEPPPHGFEMGARFLFLAVTFGPPLIVGALVVLYLLFVPEPI